MKNFSKFFSTSGFLFLAASLLFMSGLLNLKIAFSYVEIENNFLAKYAGIPLVVFITIIFGAGWWFEKNMERLIISKGWNIGIYMPGAILVVVSGILGLMFTATDGFLQSITVASGYMLTCGYFFRFSSLPSETIAKLQMRN